MDVKQIKQQQSETFAKWQKLYAMETSGQLPKNSVFENLYDKITTQYVIDTFEYNNPVVEKYMKASILVGGVHEILDVEFANMDQFDSKAPWWSETFTNKVNSQWASITWEDRYWLTFQYDQMARAFTDMNYFNFVAAQIKLSIPKRKTYEWYNRIINLHKQYNQVIEIEIPSGLKPKEEAEYVSKFITLTMKEFTLPGNKFNERGRINATPFKDQYLTWNVNWLNEFEWLMSTVFSTEALRGMGVEGMLTSHFVDYGDSNIIAVLDTANSIYLSNPYTLAGPEPMIAVKRENFYLHETWISTIVKSENKVIFKKKASGTTPKALSEDLTNTTLGKLENNQEATISTKLVELNPNLKINEIEIKNITTTGANVVVKANSTVYKQGSIPITFTVNTVPK